MPNQVTLDWNEYQTMKTRITELEAASATVNIQLAPVPIDESAALAALHGAIPIVQFAIANLPPETIKGWPYRALRALADALESGNVDPDPSRAEFPLALRTFARECSDLEGRRNTRAAVLAEMAEAAAHTENESETGAGEAGEEHH